MTLPLPPIQPIPTQRNKFNELARASWIAPLIGIALNLMMVSAQVPPGSKSRMLGVLFCLIGFVCGLIALCGIPKHGAKGILGSALAGLGITGFLIFSAAMGYAAQKKHLAQRQVNSDQALQEGKDAFLDYPGWFGKG